MRSNFYLLAAILLSAAVLVGAKAIIDTVRADFYQRQEVLQEDETARMKKLRKDCADMWPLRGENYIDCVTEQ